MISEERLRELWNESLTVYYEELDDTHTAFARAVEAESVIAMRAENERLRHDLDRSMAREHERLQEVERLRALLLDVRETLAHVENTSEIDLADACWCGVYDRIDAALGETP